MEKGAALERKSCWRLSRREVMGEETGRWRDPLDQLEGTGGFRWTCWRLSGRERVSNRGLGGGGRAPLPLKKSIMNSERERERETSSTESLREETGRWRVPLDLLEALKEREGLKRGTERWRKGSVASQEEFRLISSSQSRT